MERFILRQERFLWRIILIDTGNLHALLIPQIVQSCDSLILCKLIYDADFTKPTVIIMGAEDTGISKEVLKLCDEQLAIPLIGSIESLNVSAAAAVMLFEVVRQRIG